jgi:hypothetical protein
MADAGVDDLLQLLTAGYGPLLPTAARADREGRAMMPVSAATSPKPHRR